MYLKKKLAGTIVFAMAVSCLPDSLLSVPHTVEEATETSVMPTAKYEMSLNGNLEVTGENGASALLVSAGMVPAEEEGQFTAGYNEMAFNTAGIQGIELKDIAVDETYTVSVWVNLPSAPNQNCPIIFVANPDNANNWLGMAGFNNESCQVWYQGNSGNISVGNALYELNSWVNYTLSVDGMTASLYQNGEKVISGSGEQIRNMSDLKNIVLGVNAWSWDGVANCLFDDVKIYDEALSETQVQALYNNGTGITLSSATRSIRPGKSTETGRIRIFCHTGG